MRQDDSLWVFVYGTLKRGGVNFPAYCSGVVSVEPAAVRGRLHEIPSGVPLCRQGVPILEVPPGDILALGGPITPQECLLPQTLPSAAAPPPASGEWLPISGELMAFADPVPRLAMLDELEEFYPQGQSSYLRVVLPLLEPAGRRAWAYVLPPGTRDPSLRLLPGVTDWEI